MRILLVYTTSIVAAIGLALLKPPSVVRAAQGSSTPQISEAATRINKGLDLKFKSEGLNVSPKARAIITQEIVGREMSSGTPPAEIKLSPEEAKDLATLLSKGTNASEVSGQLAIALLADQKLKAVSANIRTDIRTEAVSANVNLQPGTEPAIQTDILRFSRGMARSGLSTDQITVVDKRYLQDVYKQAGSGASISLERYRQIQHKLFPTVVRLNIVTVPPGAAVQVIVGGTNAPIGTTNIAGKPFDPNQEYLFLFSLPGYEDSERRYDVNPYPPTQTLEEVLIKK